MNSTISVTVDPLVYQQFLNYREHILSGLTNHGQLDNNICMKGAIRTKEKCPKCKGKFEDTGKALVCPSCLTMPIKYYIDIYWRGKHKIYSDKDGRTLSSYELASRVLAEIRQAIDKKSFDPKDYIKSNIKKLQFETSINAWLLQQKKRLDKKEIAPSYFCKVASIANNYLIPFFGIKDVREVRKADIVDFKDGLPEHLSLKSIRNIMSILHKYFFDLYEREDIKQIPKFPNIEAPEPHWNWVDIDVQEAIFNKIPGRHKPIFTFIKETTGCRPGEARAIWKEDIDLKEKTAIIRRSFSDNEYREFTKTKTQRVIPLSDELAKTLKTLSVISGFLFLDPKGKPYNRTALGEIFNSAKKKVNIDSDLTVYQWGRHSFASQAIN